MCPFFKHMRIGPQGLRWTQTVKFKVKQEVKSGRGGLFHNYYQKRGHESSRDCSYMTASSTWQNRKNLLDRNSFKQIKYQYVVLRVPLQHNHIIHTKVCLWFMSQFSKKSLVFFKKKRFQLTVTNLVIFKTKDVFL